MKIKNTTKIIIIMGLIIFGGISVYAYNFVTERAYQSGINDAVILINQQLLDNLNQNGYIPYIYPINKTDSINIKLIPQLYEEGE